MAAPSWSDLIVSGNSQPVINLPSLSSGDLVIALQYRFSANANTTYPSLGGDISSEVFTGEDFHSNASNTGSTRLLYWESDGSYSSGTVTCAYTGTSGAPVALAVIVFDSGDYDDADIFDDFGGATSIVQSTRWSGLSRNNSNPYDITSAEPTTEDASRVFGWVVVSKQGASMPIMSNFGGAGWTNIESEHYSAGSNDPHVAISHKGFAASTAVDAMQYDGDETHNGHAFYFAVRDSSATNVDLTTTTETVDAAPIAPDITLGYETRLEEVGAAAHNPQVFHKTAPDTPTANAITIINPDAGGGAEETSGMLMLL